MTHDTTSAPSGRIVLLVGNPAPRSRTLSIGRAVAERLSRILGGGSVDVIDLATLASRVLDSRSAEVDDALRRTVGADLLVVATPIYKASYTGLLKAFLDRFAPNALARTIAVPLIVSAAAEHALAGEVHLRPLLVELGALVPTRAIAIVQSDAPDPSAAIDAWLDAARDPLLRTWRSTSIHADLSETGERLAPVDAL
jgi:FMN reductase